ncbi:MAG: DNA alkylation repair protein [Verrucomicrobiota bacterium]
MTATEALAELESKGTEQTRKIYLRHGVVEEMFGVSYGDLDKLAKVIRRQKATEIADDLWESQNHDAKVLATKLFGDQPMTQAHANQLAKGVRHPLQSTGLAEVVAKQEYAPVLAEKWIVLSVTRSLWKVHLGWATVASIAVAKKPPRKVENSWFHPMIETIESTIHDSPNDLRGQMNDSLIAIGSRDETLRDLALDAAKRIGVVDVDHGETSCKTPDATAYIEKVWARKQRSSS